ncbi:MAG TPA: histidine phosphatase family protein [Burkholderiales bacterium]
MTDPQRRLFLAFALALAAPLAGAQMLSDADLVNALRGGGYVIVFRHGATYPDQADTDPLNADKPGNEAKQRQLNDKGKALARDWGDSFRKLGIPVGAVSTSMIYRAQETAKLMNVGAVTTTWDLTEGNQIISPNENNKRALALRKLASTLPAEGKNNVYVTHKPNVIDAFGKDWFDVKEGEASVFKPDGKGGYRAVARLQADQWAVLASKFGK